MKKILTALLFCLSPVLFAAAGENGGWEQLFNGKDLSGWRVECKPADKSKVFWTVEGGTILCNSIGRKDHDYVWLLCDREYSDFELRLKFQAYPESQGNSGLQFRSRYDATLDNGGWMNGPQVDIQTYSKNNPWRTGLIYDETHEVKRWIYPSLPDWKMEDKYKPEKYIMKYAGDKDGDGWNELILICKGMHITAIVNGIVRTDWDATGMLDTEAHKKRNVGQSGQFAFQLHKGNQLKIRFKDIEVRKIKASDQPNPAKPDSRDNMK